MKTFDRDRASYERADTGYLHPKEPGSFYCPACGVASKSHRTAWLGGEVVRLCVHCISCGDLTLHYSPNQTPMRLRDDCDTFEQGY